MHKSPSTLKKNHPPLQVFQMLLINEEWCILTYAEAKEQLVASTHAKIIRVTVEAAQADKEDFKEVAKGTNKFFFNEK